MNYRHPSLLEPAGHAYQSARLRWATHADSLKLSEHFQQVWPEQEEGTDSLNEWLEHGGAIMLENENGELLSAMRWCEAPEGWLLDRACTRAEAHGLGFGRWLMTKVEALAIRHNIPVLTVHLPDDEEIEYYRRMGYELEQNGSGFTASKQVGGTWQMRKDNGR